MEIVFIGNFGTSMQSFAFYTVFKAMNQEIKERLLQLRENINEVDEELLKVLNRRAELVIEVGQIKQKENIQVDFRESVNESLTIFLIFFHALDIHENLLEIETFPIVACDVFCKQSRQAFSER